MGLDGLLEIYLLLLPPESGCRVLPLEAATKQKCDVELPDD
jgi:hypothetical protein